MNDEENILTEPKSTNGCYCSVRGTFLRKTEKAILLIKDHKPHWFPLSVIYVADPLEDRSIITIDIPQWMACKHNLAISYDPVTKEGKQHNEKLGFAGFGLCQPSSENHRQEWKIHGKQLEKPMENSVPVASRRTVKA